MTNRPSLVQQRSQMTAQSGERTGNRTAGLRFWVPLAAIVLVGLAAIPIVVVVTAKLAGAPIGSGGSLGDLLGVLGGIMGAIFTAGGLVVALVSIYTQLAIESRIRTGFEALQPELDERTQRQIEAHLAFTRATEEHDWRRSQELAISALEKWPTLYGVRAYLGEKMAGDVLDWFYKHKVEHLSPSRFSIPSFDNIMPPGAEAFIPGFTNPIIYEREENVPDTEAAHWLLEAIDHGEDSDGRLLAELALMQAVKGRFSDMISELSQAVSVNEYLKVAFTSPIRLAAIAYACGNTDNVESNLNRVGELIGFTLPAPRDLVLQSLTGTLSSLASSRPTSWIAFRRTNLRSAQTRAALSILMIGLNGPVEDRTGTASWMIGRPDDEVYVPADRAFIPIQALVSQLEKEFVFVCKSSPEWSS